MEEKRKDFPIKLIILGFVLLAIGSSLAWSVNYHLAMHEKIPVMIRLPLKNSTRIELPSSLSLKTYYNVTYYGDRYVNLSLVFLNSNSTEVGRLIIRDAQKNTSGFIYFEDKPAALLVNRSCSSCSSTVFLTFYFAKYNEELVLLESIISAFLSLIGGVSLLFGGYLYVAYKNRDETTPSQFFQEEPEQQQ
ncbi:MAG: hypothetical protein ACP5IE_01560 [Infirmifilum sp.]